MSTLSGLLVPVVAWREALAIAPGTVTVGTQSGGLTWVMKATAAYAGAVIRLVGFGDRLEGAE
ncbi:hypothetical protein JNUCC64_18160 [Streptomyces sp. JNUCC 64]